MGEVVNKITITQTVVRAEEAAGAYTVEVYWQLNGGSSCTYKGNYTLLLLEDGVQKEQCSLQDTVGAHNTQQEFTNLVKEKSYTVLLRAEQGSTPVVSEESNLLLQTFEEITGCFNGRELMVYWGETSREIVRGELTLWSDSRAAYTCEVPMYSNFMNIGGVGFNPSEHIYVSISPNDGIHAFGPESKVLEFYEDACEIRTLDYQQDEEQTKVELGIASWQEAGVSETVQIVFQKQGRELLQITGIMLQKREEILKAEVTVPYTKLRREEIAGSEVFCYREKEGALSNIESTKNHISFAVPEINIVKRTAKEVKIEWEYCGEVMPDFYITDQGEKIYDTQYTLPLEKADTFCLAAGFEKEGAARRGSYAEISNVFRQGYYPVLQEDGSLACVYHQNSFSEKSVSHPFFGHLFETEPEFPVTAGGICLDKQGDGYLLKTDTVDLITAADFQEFLTGIRDVITPYGFYLCTEALSRMAYQKVPDTVYFSCGYEGKNRICDLRPGYVLEVQTEIYMPQENPDMDNSAGFVTSFQEEYPVSFPMEEGGKFLEFNSFLEGYADFMDNSSRSDDTNVIYTGGLRDFLTPRARQPFYRIVYPSTLPDSGQAEITYPSENIILLAAGSYGEIQEATDAILEDPSSVNHLNIPVMLFRGRSTLWSAIHIILNGETRKMPVGITLGKVLQKLGIYCQRGAVPKTLRLYRRDPNGREVPVYWDWTSCPMDEFVMVNGDRIEV